MGGAPQDLQQVVGALGAVVGCTVGVVPGEDLVGAGDDGVGDVVELGQHCGLVEVIEPSEGFEGAVVVLSIVPGR